MTNQDQINFDSFMSWTNTQVRNNPFPLERYSVFTTLSDASEYALSGAVAYEGQIIAVTDTDLSGNPLQKVYVLDSTMPNGLRQLAAGDDASSIQNELNAEISARKEADNFLSNFISTDISNAITAEVNARETDVAALSAAISSEVETRISADEYLSTNLSISLEEGATTLSSVLKSYVLKQGTREVGTIDIPKDFLVKSAKVKTVLTADVPYEGAIVGDKYIDFTVNSRTLIPAVGEFQDYPAGTAFYADQFGTTLVDTSAFLPTTDVSAYFVVDGSTESHIYLNVKDLVDVYTAGWGLGLGDGTTTYDDGTTTIPDGAFYAKINNANRNGLEVTSDGIGLNLATATHDEYEAATGTAQAGVTYYSDNQGTVADPQPAVGSDVTGYYVAVEVAATAGAMSGLDKDKLEEAYFAITVGSF